MHVKRSHPQFTRAFGESKRLSLSASSRSWGTAGIRLQQSISHRRERKMGMPKYSSFPAATRRFGTF